MIGVPVGDHGAFDRPDGVDVEVAWRAVEALGLGAEEFFRSKPVHGVDYSSRRRSVFRSLDATSEEKAVSLNG
jgi:hypothetical protein